jgi:hypothetical protein
MGLPASVAADGGRRHALLYVEAVSIARRLSGAYYPAGMAKHQDARPNTNGLDCACRDRTEADSYLAYDSHIEAVRADLASRQLNDALLASALSVIAAAKPQPELSSPPLQKSAAKRQIVSVPLATAIAVVVLATRRRK